MTNEELDALQRYTRSYDDMEPTPYGSWVAHDDAMRTITTLRAERDALRAQLATARSFFGDDEDFDEEIAKVKARARADAIREAAAALEREYGVKSYMIHGEQVFGAKSGTPAACYRTVISLLDPPAPDPVAQAARVLLDACPNPLFDQLKPVMMGEITERFVGMNEDGEEESYTRSVSWDAMKQVLRLALRALAGEGKA